MQGFEVKEIETLGTDARGTTRKLNLTRMGEVMQGYRAQGSLSGGHYHTGLSSTKNPEIFMLLQGKVLFRLYAVETKEYEEIEIEAPKEIHIYPKIWHEVEGISDFLFLELNTLQQHADDTHRIPREEVIPELVNGQ